MIIQVLHCPNCQGTDIVRHGQTRQGQQRSRCREKCGAGRTFLLAYAYAGQAPEVKQQIVDMAMNASGIRDTARVLHISPNTVLAELKKRHLRLSKWKGPIRGSSASPRPISAMDMMNYSMSVSTTSPSMHCVRPMRPW